MQLLKDVNKSIIDLLIMRQKSNLETYYYKIVIWRKNIVNVAIIKKK